MRNHKEIKKDIQKLEIELHKSITFYEYELIYDDSKKTDDTVGFFDLGKARIILEELYKGTQLQIRHEGMGNADVKLGGGKNMFIVENSRNDNFNINNIMSFIIWHAGKWYKKKN